MTPETTMRKILTNYPGAQRALMRRYHIGGCSSCGFHPDEPLKDVLSRHNVLDSNEVIDHIKESHEQDQSIQMDVKALASELKNDNPPKLLDVRTPEEHAICKLDGGQLVTQQLVEEIMNTWPKDTPMVTYCHHGFRSLDAASFLIGHGFTNVRSLTGGIDAWSVDIDSSVPRY